MKGFVLLCMLLLTVIATFMYLGHDSSKGSISTNPGTVAIQKTNATSSMWKSRKLMDDSKNIGKSERDDDEGNVELEDYKPVDPVPGSGASVEPGPILHGARHSPPPV